MKCRECIFMSDFGDGLYRCTNHDSVMYMTYTGICCEDECPDGEPFNSTEKEGEEMSVLIKGMEMPECCDVCRFGEWSKLHQTACCKLKEHEPCFAEFSKEYRSKRADFCPLVALPEKHGRLIDFEALIEKYWDGNSMTITEWDLKDIKAVIEAEDE